MPVLASILSGWFAGNLINYLAVLAWPGDRHCSACQAPLNLLNWIPWPRPCQVCRQSLNPSVWLVQFIAMLATLLLWPWPPKINLALGFVVLVYFGASSLVDIRHHRIPYTINAVGGLVGLTIGWTHLGLGPSLVGGIAALFLLLVVYFFGELIRRQSYRWPSFWLPSTPNHLSAINPQEPVFFGFGDVLFGAGIGLMVGWPDIWMCLLIALISAGAFGIVTQLIMLFRHRYRMKTALPLVPFFVFGAVSILFLR